MTDRELLELAARAIGGSDVVWTDIDGNRYTGDPERPWNPLEDDGDALRLAVYLNMDICVDDHLQEVTTSHPGNPWPGGEKYDGDKFKAARKSIVRAAAEIGKAMQEGK